MQARTLIGLGVAAAGVVAGLVLWRAAGGREARPGGPGTAVEAPVAARPGAPLEPPGLAGRSVPPGPVAPSPPVRIDPPVGGGTLEPAATPGFADEPRDPAWADAHERDTGDDHALHASI